MADSKAGALKIYDDLRHLVVSGNKVLRREKKKEKSKSKGHRSQPTGAGMARTRIS